uniref:Uncharacterized protein n=1 Tax=Arion vulgaris TaxID=1028688 RepID=A0A0B6ZLM9_9EUPU
MCGCKSCKIDSRWKEETRQVNGNLEMNCGNDKCGNWHGLRWAERLHTTSKLGHL